MLTLYIYFLYVHIYTSLWSEFAAAVENQKELPENYKASVPHHGQGAFLESSMSKMTTDMFSMKGEN